jgi:two-component system OmpR family response regulator
MAATFPKVLVVDDEAGVGEVLSYGLSVAGFDVQIASTGTSALTATVRAQPDVILLDVMLPDIDGFTLLPKLRSLTKSPVIFLTARSRNGDRERGIKLGAVDYLTKPFDMEDLVRRLRAALA